MVGDILQPTHLLFVLVVALLVLGPKRLPEVGRALGRTMRDFRSAISGEDRHEQVITETASPPPAVNAPEPPPAAQAPTEERPTEVAEPRAPNASEPATEARREPTPTR